MEQSAINQQVQQAATELKQELQSAGLDEATRQRVEASIDTKLQAFGQQLSQAGGQNQGQTAS